MQSPPAAVEMGHGGAYYWKGKVPAAQFFAGVPFGFTADEINAWVNRGGGLRAVGRALSTLQHETTCPAATPAPRCLAGLTKKSIRSMTSRDLKMRFPRVWGRSLQTSRRDSSKYSWRGALYRHANRHH